MLLTEYDKKCLSIIKGICQKCSKQTAPRRLTYDCFNHLKNFPKSNSWINAAVANIENNLVKHLNLRGVH